MLIAATVSNDKLCVQTSNLNLGNIKILAASKQQLLKTLIVDDESLARRGLAHRLKNIADIEVVGEARNGREALDLIAEKEPGYTDARRQRFRSRQTTRRRDHAHHFVSDRL